MIATNQINEGVKLSISQKKEPTKKIFTRISRELRIPLESVLINFNWLKPELINMKSDINSAHRIDFHDICVHKLYILLFIRFGSNRCDPVLYIAYKYKYIIFTSILVYFIRTQNADRKFYNSCGVFYERNQLNWFFFLLKSIARRKVHTNCVERILKTNWMQHFAMTLADPWCGVIETDLNLMECNVIGVTRWLVQKSDAIFRPSHGRTIVIGCTGSFRRHSLWRMGAGFDKNVLSFFLEEQKMWNVVTFWSPFKHLEFTFRNAIDYNRIFFASITPFVWVNY